MKNCKQTDFKVHVWPVVEPFYSLEFHSDMKTSKNYFVYVIKCCVSVPVLKTPPFRCSVIFPDIVWYTGSLHGDVYQVNFLNLSSN